ncbi:hypothetical protein KUTeg_007016 [Tegillarca granosa]|uniref:Uncharacterized protein n=1 Tax=Tegillarca granosa TaxID=220873 RepID=A0ABQ9FE05_TEGGR|nr:hypothetical protein KUTeg_007016 [Tegillarca granosa]
MDETSSEETFILHLKVNNLQKETIFQMFCHHNWDFIQVPKEKVNTLSKQTQTLTIEDFRQEVTVTPADTDIQDSGILQVNTFRLQQNEQEPECQYCLCKPCITNENNKQLWWEDEPLPPRDNNNKERKERYKYFWTMLLHRGVWDDERYKERKSLAINKDPQRKRFVWHKRDIMPLCVLKLVRYWYPNPEVTGNIQIPAPPMTVNQCILNLKII